MKRNVFEKPFYLIAKYWLGELQGFIKIGDNKEEITKLFAKEREKTKRLCSIIDELEKILKARIYNAETKEEIIYSIEDKSILDILQELKGSDKE